MKELDLFQEHFWKPFKYFGLESPLLYLNAKTIIDTWIVLFIILTLGLSIKYFLKNKRGIPAFIIISSVRSFKDLFLQNINTFYVHHFSFVFSIFSFILACNLIAIVPFIEEPTSDVNTTLALGTIAFIYVQWATIKAHGYIAYIKEYFAPFFLLFPLNVIGELSKVISLSFRLFGNIFGGSIISKLWLSAVSGFIITEIIALPLNLLIAIFFILFEGFIQAFVFTMLTLTYLSVAIQNEEEIEEEEKESSKV